MIELKFGSMLPEDERERVTQIRGETCCGVVGRRSLCLRTCRGFSVDIQSADCLQFNLIAFNYLITSGQEYPKGYPLSFPPTINSSPFNIYIIKHCHLRRILSIRSSYSSSTMAENNLPQKL